MSRFVIKMKLYLGLRAASRPCFPGGGGRADRERREDIRKQAKADAFLAADGTVAEREAAAILADAYVAASEGYYAAVELDEQYRNLRANARTGDRGVAVDQRRPAAAGEDGLMSIPENQRELPGYFSLADKIACLDREIRLRKRTYPSKVAHRRMTRAKAD